MAPAAFCGAWSDVAPTPDAAAFPEEIMGPDETDAAWNCGGVDEAGLVADPGVSVPVPAVPAAGPALTAMGPNEADAV
ncbi:hypothetical protein AA13595_0968 [Gluconacetobacter johannae DSM 13595]|nr:hypothetical protein AA13595_0968 [Gluconacetobacter johannae DSM 13595]